ncbi:MAG: hypothetical protein GY736_05905 [Sphingomonas sp.]|uniref:hypothetical protein n=1 Tax=Sphingomonas sp. TaxID=28214 RepID=UPI00258C617F|nr:hypothetical protein [Sphingomonas sp.]MCP4025833.1 hypothetical protein [Sphingomonas sp.]
MFNFVTTDTDTDTRTGRNRIASTVVVASRHRTRAAAVKTGRTVIPLWGAERPKVGAMVPTCNANGKVYVVVR